MSLTIAALGEIAEVAAGGGAPQNADAFTAEGTPFIRAGSLSPLVNGASESTLEHLTDEVAKEHGLRKFPRDTVVFAKSGMSATKGHVYRLRNEAYVVNHLAAIVPTQRVVPEFLEHSLRVFSPVRLIQDAAYPSVRLSDVATMKIPLPPLAEQRRIAKVLDLAEELRVKRRAAFAQLDPLTQSIFLDLFGDIRKHRLVPFESLASNKRHALSSGPFGSSLTSKHYVDDGVLVLRGTNVTAGDITLHDCKFVSESKAIELSRSLISPLDIVIVAVGASGFACLIPKDFPAAVMSQNFNKISPNLELVDPAYLVFLLNSS